jgi:hypothetical protein
MTVEWFVSYSLQKVKLNNKKFQWFFRSKISARFCPLQIIYCRIEYSKFIFNFGVKILKISI